MPEPLQADRSRSPSLAANAAFSGMVRLPGGDFTMGSDDFYPEEKPCRRVRVSAFCIDMHPVTNKQFSEFVAATGYTTLAERPIDPTLYPGVPREALQPGSLVVSIRPGVRQWGGAADWWDFVPGTSWRCPYGPGSSIEGLDDHPVVHVSYEDALAFAFWCGKDLPTEAEWEYAARGGLDGASYAWGSEFKPAGRTMANTWPGENFPLPDKASGRVGNSTPVCSFPPNGYGLHDMIGNVWEWTRDWYRSAHDAVGKPGGCCIPTNPIGANADQSFDPAQPHIKIPRKVLKGGSFLCAPNYCRRYRPAARQPQMIDSTAVHIGFRCVVRFTKIEN